MIRILYTYHTRKGGLLTLVDRLSRYSLVEKVEDKSSKSIIEAFNRMKKKIPAEYLKTNISKGNSFFIFNRSFASQFF